MSNGFIKNNEINYGHVNKNLSLESVLIEWSIPAAYREIT